MNFSKKKPYEGTKAREKTRDELLAEVRAERAERGEARKCAASATCIQRHWRGHQARTHVQAAIASQCLERLAQGHPFSAAEVADFLVPRLLSVLAPAGPAVIPVERGSSTGEPPAEGAACGRPLRAEHANYKPPHTGQGTQLKLIRSGLAALISSLSSASPANNFLALGLPQPHHHHHQQQQHQQQQQGENSSTSSQRTSHRDMHAGWHDSTHATWLRQCARLQLLCCSLVGCWDAVVDAAAVRVLVLMIDPSQSKLDLNADTKTSIAVSVHEQLVHKGQAALFEALGRLLTNAACTEEKSNAGADGAPTAEGGAAAHKGGGALPGAGPVLQRLLSLALSVLRYVSSEDQQLRAYTYFVRHVLVAPGAIEQLPPSTKAELRSPTVLLRICTSFCASSSTLSGIDALWSLANLTLLVVGEYNTAWEQTGASGGKHRCVRTLRDPHVFSQPQLAFAYTQAACSLMAAALRSPIVSVMLSGPGAQPHHTGGFPKAGSAGSGSSAGGGTQHGHSQKNIASHQGSSLNHSTFATSPPAPAQAQNQPQQNPPRQFPPGQKTPGPNPPGQSSAAAASQHHSSTQDGAVPTGIAASALWPLAQRSFILQLFSQTCNSDRGHSMAQLCGLYGGALLLMPALSRQLISQGHAGLASEVPSVLSALAFCPGILPQMWRWLGTNIGLPIEAPRAATKGLDVAALGRGYSSLLAEHALVLGLFCKLYNHLLMVLNDSEFYQDSPTTGTLSLSQSRAVVTSLNSLVFHTFLPKTSSYPSSHPSSHHQHHHNPQQQLQSQQHVNAQQDAHPVLAVSACGGEAAAMLMDSAPQLLRSLYERDARRSFCQPLVWLAPYSEMFGDASAPAPEPSTAEEGAGADPGAVHVAGFPAAVVLQSLMASKGGSLDTGDEQEGISGAGKLHKGTSHLRPSAVAALLCTAPQCVPFSRRVDLFRALLAADMRKHGFNRPVYAGGVPPIKVTVRRGPHLVADAYRALAGLGPALRTRLAVAFVNEQGLNEAGLDYGGLTKELLEEVVARGFHADYGLFTTTADGLLYPSPSADKIGSGLQMLVFLGSMVGKALYEGMLLNLAFAPFFVSRLQGRTPLLDDLLTLDPELYRSLLMVKSYDGDVSDLGLTFSTTDDFFGQTTTHALLPGHADTPVTNENRLLYCHLLADWHLNVRLGRPAEAFAQGLSQLVSPATLRLFNPKEFNQLVSGDSEDGGQGVDVDDMRRHTRYGGGYTPDSSAVALFWKVVSEFKPTERSQLLKFITSCSRAPLGGFKYLHPPLLIHKVECEASMFAVLPGVQDVERLPTASTCHNTLKLPNYRRKDTMRKKLLHAIYSNAGFDLS